MKAIFTTGIRRTLWTNKKAMNMQAKRSLLIAFAAVVTQPAFAQNERDALRLSFLQPQGTARSIGFGSALGSVGGDFTTLSVNPAGIGIYRRSEMTLTPSVTFNNTSGSYAGNTRDEGGSHFSFSNAGIVTTKVETGRRRTGWTTVSFGFGLNRLADFTGDYQYEGSNTTSSGSYVFESDANDYGLSSNGLIYSPGDLGYQSYLLDTIGSGYKSVVKRGTPVGQHTIVRERGGIGELAFTLGASYEDKLMLGGTIGVPIARYTSTRTYEEYDLSGDRNNDFDYFGYYNDVRINGAGINFKAGFIYKLVDNFRFGAAFHTPTYFSLTDRSVQSLTANTELYAGINTAIAAENHYDYNLTTPWRGIVSATALLGGSGFFTIDYEYVNYASAHFKLSDQSYEHYLNDMIKSTYQGASNVRMGVELRKDNFMIRGGFGYYGNPYKSGAPNAQRLDYSGGIGFRFENTFIDLGYVHHHYEESEQPYTLPDQSPYLGLIVPTAQLNTGANNILMTLGYKF